MSILNCSCRLTIVNCTGLNARFEFLPLEQHMRLQPIDNANVSATIDTNASTVTEWFKEWWQLISYGPTYNKLVWNVSANSQDTVRFEVKRPIKLKMDWDDQSVSWEKTRPGAWSIDIAKAIDVTLYLRAEVGKYNQTRTLAGPSTVKSVELKPYLELACDDQIPFVIEQTPVADMFWSAQINLDAIVNPNQKH